MKTTSKNKRQAKADTNHAPLQNNAVDTASSVVTHELMEKVSKLYEAEENDAIIDILTPLLKIEPDNNVLLIYMARALSSKGQLEAAFKYHVESLCNHTCQHAIFYLALFFKLIGQFPKAIGLWKSIIEIADEPNAEAENTCSCCEMFGDFKSVVADSRFMLSVSYLQKGKPRLSLRYKREYIRDLEAGVAGTFPAEAIDGLKELKRYTYVEAAEIDR